MTSNDLTFDEEQHVHILPEEQQKEAAKIVEASKQYRETLEQFNVISSRVITQIDELASQTEKRRKRALGLRALNASNASNIEFQNAIGRAKLSARQFDLESVKMEVGALEVYGATFKQTKTAITEIFGGQ